MTKNIYLDYQATTPCDPRVFKAMEPYFEVFYGNAHSRSHPHGWKAEEATEKARAQVAASIHADPREIIFTSGATEANNLAIKGVADFYRDQKNHIITLKTEHKCVLESCRSLESRGFDVTYLPVQVDGLVDLKVLEAAMTPQTLLVSIMAVNNEIGVIQPLAAIGALCRSRGVLFHTDAAQALGKISLDVEAMQIDLLSLSGHKMYGPKGIGALYVRRKPRVRLTAQISGGGQERGMRSGTLPVPLCVGMGEAAQIAVEEMPSEVLRLEGLRDLFLEKIMAAIPEVYINGSMTARVPGNLNLSFAYVEGEGMMMGIKNLSVSSGSACTSSSLEPSYVLRALGVDVSLAHTSLRIGLGRFTTKEDVLTAADAIIKSATHLRNMSPLWEMAQAGIDITSIRWAEH